LLLLMLLYASVIYFAPPPFCFLYDINWISQFCSFITFLCLRVFVLCLFCE
jgi:hypothetical protein